ncbi:MAG TPA: phosphate signaling complex protein PhoU [Candidatus Limnocylindrales bacterium]|nr:phosphate signaling complex protein PhoU [Candidatus Limnocylindrales bacterium]
MPKHLDLEIEKLKKQILSLAAFVEESVARSVAAINARDAGAGQQVIDFDSHIDALEVEVEEECLKLLALHQPVAQDLRFIVACIRLNSDLERIGDLAVNIGERAVFLSSVAEVSEKPLDVGAMAKLVRSMLSEALNALVNLDARLARRVCAMDDEADSMHRDTFRRVEDAVGRHPSEFATLTHYLSVSRYLERIADHATNIAEDVIYMVEGEIARHRSGD